MTTDTKLIRTVCPAHCGIDACGILAHVKADRVVKVEPTAFPDPKMRRICLRGLSSLDITYHPDRLQYPMRRAGKRGEGKFERISWAEALDYIADIFKHIAARYGWPAIAWVLGGPGSGTTKFGVYLRLASLTGSTRVSAWGYGDAALPCGSRVIFGTQFPYGLLFGQLWSGSTDADMVVVWGANPGESQPLNLMRPIMDAKANGARLVVIDPHYTATASKADQFIGVKPGTDTALALGLMHVIFAKGLQDDAFILRHTVGSYLVRDDNGQYLRGRHIGLPEENEYIIWDQDTNSAKARKATGSRPALTGSFTVNGIACKPSLQFLRNLVLEYTPRNTAEITGVDVSLITGLAERIGTSTSVIFVTHMGFTRTYHGDISLRGLGTVAALTGNISATFKGGHLPAVLNWNPFLKAKPEGPSYSRLGILQLYDAVIKEKPYPAKAAWFSFINFLNQCAHSGKIAAEMFPQLDLIVGTELFMTPTARYADILLPVCSYLEFQERCIGCEACTVACSKENNGWSGWIRVTTQNSPRKDTPAGTFPNVNMSFLPVLCNHCDRPPCKNVCPLEAISKLDNGVVILDEDQCDGCRTCLDACPYGAIKFDERKDKAGKCNLCSHRIEDGLEPFCVICCEGQAIHFGDLSGLHSRVSEILQSHKIFNLKPDEGTGPAVYYLPPKTPRGLY